ncbi:50S ribosomal protein L5 [Candidatus Woesearchaeota archaeon]|nr:50S ribosomal protein L5 [Candidatus Woesearchaeota archaeon]
MSKTKKEVKKKKGENPMRMIGVEKITLNFSAGKDQNLLNKGVQLLEHISGVKPVLTKTNKRIPTWGLRPGLPIGCKITLRGEKAEALLLRLLKAKSMTLQDSSFDGNGNISFGIHEYINIPDVKYEPDIGIIGLQVSITLRRPGFRVKNRSVKKSFVGKNHVVNKDESINYFVNKYGVKLGEA